MKFLKYFIVVVLALLLASPVWGSVGAKNHGSTIGEATEINFSTGLTATSDGSTVTVVHEVSTGTVQLPINTFTLDTASAPLSTSTTPGLEIDNVLPAIVWADGETSAVQVTFKVPQDYSSGGLFRLLCDNSAATATAVDFDVYVNAAGSAWDAAATDQTPVALTNPASSPETVTLTVATDFAALAAGQYVTLRLWRDDTGSTDTADLELYHAEFYYTRK